MYSSEQNSEVSEFPILTNRSRVWPVYTLQHYQEDFLAKMKKKNAKKMHLLNKYFLVLNQKKNNLQQNKVR